ncbi:MAG TPA: hypothetical protein VF444_21900 [Pseudonocardiaceae bacterium]
MTIRDQPWTDIESCRTLAVLDAEIDRLRKRWSEAEAIDRADIIQPLATGLQDRMSRWLDDMAGSLRTRLTELDPQVAVSVDSAAPPDARARHWRQQLARAAEMGNALVDARGGVWWNRLRVGVPWSELRYLAFLHRVRQGGTAMLALTVYAELLLGSPKDDQRYVKELVVSTPTETVTWTDQDTAEARWEDVEDILDTTLAAGIQKFMSSLG